MACSMLVQCSCNGLLEPCVIVVIVISCNVCVSDAFCVHLRQDSIGDVFATCVLHDEDRQTMLLLLHDCDSIGTDCNTIESCARILAYRHPSQGRVDPVH